MEKLKQNHIVEWSVLCLFVITYVVVTIFHEPFYDELEAWQIAKCAPLKDIFFFNPHYEGHPPLWYLVLLIPARLHVPVEVGLKTIAGLFMLISVYLIEFTSPFSKFVKAVIPFTYFIFYQYGVIARPYCMMLLACILIAITYKDKKEKPLLFVLSLAFLCLTSAYGIVFAGGIAIAWCLEILFSKSFKWGKDKRFWCLLGLLVLAICLILEIMPKVDTMATFSGRNGSLTTGGSIATGFLYAFVMMVPDCFLTSNGVGYVGSVDFSFPIVLVSLLFDILILGSIILWSGKKHVAYLFTPLVLFMVFFSLVYSSYHHAGLIIFLFLFYYWINLDDKDRNPIGEKIIKKITFLEKSKEQMKQIGMCFLGICLLVPLFWSIIASGNDVKYAYDYSRGTAAFIKENNLDSLRIFSEYGQYSEGDKRVTNLNSANYGMQVTAYFDKNIVANLGNGDEDKAYNNHLILSKDKREEQIKILYDGGIPDVLLGDFDLSDVYGNSVTLASYIPIYRMECIIPSVWKTSTYTVEDGNYDFLYIRKDLAKQYSLEAIPMN